MVDAVELTSEDLPENYGPDQFRDLGDRVQGYVTMDMCGATFPSEDLRTARNQVGYQAPNGDSVSSETVAYEPGGAAQALDELRQAIADCPSGFVRSSVGGVPPYKQRVTVLPIQPAEQDELLALRIQITTKDGDSFSGALIYQRQDEVITAVYVHAGPKDSVELANEYATLLNDRLSAILGTA